MENVIETVTANGQTVNKPTYLETKNQRYLILDCPNNDNIAAYVDIFKKKKVSTLVRACEPTYSKDPLIQAGIKVLDLPFADGDPPPQEVVDAWLNLVESEFKPGSDRAVAVHCVAGLGRAPVLVAFALVQSGMDPTDAIDFIRKRRRGAINARQLKWIQEYKPKKRNTCLIS